MAFKNYAGLLVFDDLLYSAVDAGAWDDGLRDKSRILYHLLVQLLRGNAAAVARSAEGANADAIVAEALAARGAEAAIAADLVAEASTARAAEEANAAAIAALTTTASNGVVGEAATARAAEASLQQQISALLDNSDPEHLDSLAEVVADYTANGATHTSNLATQAAKQEADRLASDARIATIEALLEQLQAAV